MEVDLEELSAALELDEDEAREEDMAGADSRGNKFLWATFCCEQRL